MQSHFGVDTTATDPVGTPGPGTVSPKVALTLLLVLFFLVGSGTLVVHVSGIPPRLGPPPRPHRAPTSLRDPLENPLGIFPTGVGRTMNTSRESDVIRRHFHRNDGSTTPMDRGVPTRGENGSPGLRGSTETVTYS